MSDVLEQEASTARGDTVELERRAFQLLDAGQFDQAAAILRPLYQRPGAGFPIACGLGIALATLGDFRGARPVLQGAAKLRNDALTFNVLSVCCFHLGDFGEALKYADLAIAMNPGFMEALSNRANALNSLARYSEALDAAAAALACDPADPELHINLANPLRALGQSNEALTCLDKALALDPASVVAHTNRGNVLQDLGRNVEAIAAYDRAVALDPSHVDAQWNRSLCCLRLGRLQEGWRGYEWRWRRGSPENEPRALAAPLWLGREDLTGRSILLHCEQGLGDSIQFIRFARTVAEQAAKVVVEAYPPLVELFGSAPGVAEIVPRGAELPHTDYQCPLMSLPLALGAAAEPFGAYGAYLRAPHDRAAQWSDRLGTRNRMRIGVVNRGRPTHENDRRRSLPLSELARALPEGADYHLLLKSGTVDDRAAAKSRFDFTVWDEAVGDLADLAALWSLMDVVISVDSAPAHLAGALGRPTWILVPFDPDWRWGLGSDSTDWYASAVLYRQGSRDDWSECLDRIKRSVERLP